MREAENWIIILVSGKGEKSLFLPAGKCCVTRQNINIYKIIIFSFLYMWAFNSGLFSWLSCFVNVMKCYILCPLFYLYLVSLTQTYERDSFIGLKSNSFWIRRGNTLYFLNNKYSVLPESMLRSMQFKQAFYLIFQTGLVYGTCIHYLLSTKHTWMQVRISAYTFTITYMFFL